MSPHSTTLRDAIRGFLERERRAGRRDVRDLHLQPLEERVADGATLAGLRLERIDTKEQTAIYRFSRNPTKLRPGDPCWLSDGERILQGLPVEIVHLDLDRAMVALRLDRFATARANPGARHGHNRAGAGGSGASPAPPTRGVLDRRNLDLTDPLWNCLAPVLEPGADPTALPGAAWVQRALAGHANLGIDPALRKRARAAAESSELTATQREAFVGAVAARELALIQGPPGTGKTRVAAAVVMEAMRHGEKVLVSALTHRAINNVLLAVQALGGPHGGRRIFKIGKPRQAPELDAVGIQSSFRLRPNPAGPKQGFVVGATAFGAAKLRRYLGSFDLIILDEAGQVPIPHAIAALAGATRAVVVGDHRQLGPVIAGGTSDDPLERSIFSLFAEHHADAIHLLRETWRMNRAICDFPSRTFYAGRLRPHPSAAERRLHLRTGGRFRAILDPSRPSVWVTVPHLARRNHSPEEARVVALLISELIRHHAIHAADIAVVSPFRAHAGAVQQALARALPEAGGALIDDLVVDTAERIQGQEREIIFYTFGSSDRDYLARNARFLFEPGRLNVALTRARTKRIIVGSPEVARVRPRDLEGLRCAALVKSLWDEHQPLAEIGSELPTRTSGDGSADPSVAADAAPIVARAPTPGRAAAPTRATDSPLPPPVRILWEATMGNTSASPQPTDPKP
jgi:DNA replication ATP-dependent helicase Dna2